MHTWPGNRMEIGCTVVYYTWAFSAGIKCQHCIRGRDLARIFITGYPNWDFKNSGCPKSLIEKVKNNYNDYVH